MALSHKNRYIAQLVGSLRLGVLWACVVALAGCAVPPSGSDSRQSPTSNTVPDDGSRLGPGPIKVEIQSSNGAHVLLRGGSPYVIRGAGVGVTEPDGEVMMRKLKAYGGNSLRTWNVGTGEFLDLAFELGLTVSLCLDVKRERHGFDYDDVDAVAQQLETFRQQVLKHRNHPALLSWVIGNELNHEMTNPRVYDAVNDISIMIHELDPNHPTTTTTAGINAALAELIEQRAPDLDFISVQVYGGLFDLLPALEEIQLEKPFMVTEWGTIGHWEVPTTSWGAPLELNSTEKAATYRRGYESVLSALGTQLLGHYAFLWGQKQERTPTWYGVFVDGKPTAAVHTLSEIWTGQKVDQAPVVEGLFLDEKQAQDNVVLEPGRNVQARALVEDDGRLEYQWALWKESEATQSGGDLEQKPAEVSGAILQSGANWVDIRTPQQSGAYRLFVYIQDQQGSVAHANLPFYVKESASE